ncbi:protein ALP1-like [Gigantopelta aegis]|uniref:protein ALP1-like n=1 Tax=Gigantopelta aegis TaxID=1735272 RepID=UPI001B88E478|nr:protein ALP1-like [Gigantopelta aegis]
MITDGGDDDDDDDDDEQWTQIAADFWLYWNFPLCLGAIDGKQVMINAPPMSGSDFFNYKKCFSIVLMAVVDARYKFSIIDVGAYGRECDSGIFGRTDFGRRLQSGTLDIPDQAVLPGSQETCPYVFVGDEAFPLQIHMMRPYPGHNIPRGQRIFNYRLSRARRISENGFGILAARWRIFQKSIEALPCNVDDIVKATVALHNYLKSSDAATVPAVRYVYPQFVDYVGEDGSLRPREWQEITRNDTN